jgi:biopolymer transport protein ExbD
MSKKMKKFGVQPVGRPASDINVTPLVDVVLVLLIIFMVVTPLLEKDIEVRVPENDVQDTDEPPPSDQLVVAIDKNGNVSLNNQQIAWNDYLEKMKRVLAAKAPGDKVVFFTPDDAANYASVVKALDGAKAAGAQVLGMVTEPVPPGATGVAPAGTTPPPAPPAPPATP